MYDTMIICGQVYVWTRLDLDANDTRLVRYGDKDCFK